MKLELKNDCMALSLVMNDCCADKSSPEKPVAANPANKYDELGVAHNAAMKFLEKKFAGSDIVIQDDLMMTGWIIEDQVVILAVMDFLQAYPFKNRDISAALKDQAELIIGEIGQWDPRPCEIPLLDGDSTPAKTLDAGKEWSNRLRKANVPVQTIGFGLSALGMGVISSQDYIDAVKKFEAAAMAAGLSKEDLQGALVVGSIARHSTEYWANHPAAAKNVSGPIGSDVKGAVSGMGAGFFTGIGILIGGVAGAIVRSAAYVAASKAVSA
jgi:hypothetical protein